MKHSTILVLAVAVSAMGLTAVHAMDDPIAARQEAMKSVGGATRTLAGITKGETEFDAAKVVEAFTTMNEVAKKYASLFPEGSETGGDTEAAPAIWSDRAGFDAAVVKFEADTAAAIAAAPADAAALGPVFGQVAGNCKACHEVYRIDK